MDFIFYWHDKGLNFCNGSLPIAATCMLHRQMYVAFSSRIESGLDQKNWATWVILLIHQVDIICKLNYLDVTWIPNRSHVHMLLICC